MGQRLLLRLPFWPVFVAAWWVAAEALRDRWPFAFPWGRLAMSQSVAPDVRWVAVGGVPLLSFLVALVGAMMARAVLVALGSGARVGWRWLPGAVAAVLTGGLVLAGGLLPVDPTGGAPTTVVAAIQGNVPRARNLPQLLNDSEVTQNHVAATLKLAAQVKAGQRPGARRGDLAGGRRRTRPVPEPLPLRRHTDGGGRHRRADPGRRGAAGPAAQRRPAVGARPRPDRDLRQTPARPVR